MNELKKLEIAFSKKYQELLNAYKTKNSEIIKQCETELKSLNKKIKHACIKVVDKIYFI